MYNSFSFIFSLLIPLGTSLTVFLIYPHARARVSSYATSHPSLRALLSWLALPKTLDRLAALAISVAMIGFPLIAFHQYEEFASFRDNVDFDISLWSLLNGGAVESMLNFSRRFNPILLALVPLYALSDDPRILLVLQSVGMAGAAFPLYWYSRRTIGRGLGLLLAIAYLSHPSIYSLNYQAIFYEIKLAIPILSFAMYFLLIKKRAPFLACLLIALFIKQEIALITLGFAFFLILIQREIKLGVAVAAVGASVALFVILVLYPELNEGRVYPQFAERYSYLGSTLDQVIASLVRQPVLIAQHASTPAKIDFVAALVAPLSILPFLGIEIAAIALPAWIYTLLSDLPQQIDPAAHYQSPLLPFLFFGAALGLRRLLNPGSPASTQSNSEPLTRRGFALAVLLLISSQLYLPATWARLFDPGTLTLSPHSLLGHQLINQIPRQGVIAAQEEFFISLFVERRGFVWDFSPRADYRRNFDYLFGDSTRKWYIYQQDTWEQLRASGYFETVLDQEGYFLLRRQALTDPTRQFDDGWAQVGSAEKQNPFLRTVGLQFQDVLSVLGAAAIPSRSVQGGNDLHFVLETRALKSTSDALIFLVTVQDERGHSWVESAREPAISAPRWKANEIIRDHFDLPLPRFMPPGDYEITLGIWNSTLNVSLGATDAAGQAQGIRPVIGTVHVEKDRESMTADLIAIERPHYTDIAEVRYLGSTEIPTQIASGEKLALGLYWRARARPRGDYDMSVQLRDNARRVAIEQTQQPAAGAYPTTQWQPGEILLDWHDLDLPADLRPDTYTLTVVVRDRANRAILGQVDIGQIQIKK